MGARGYTEWHFHVHDSALGKLPVGKNCTGQLVIATAGSPASPTVYTNEHGTTLTATFGIAVMSLVGGQARFWTEPTVTSLDIAWMTNDGLCGFRRAVASDNMHQLQVDSTNGKIQHFSMPFIADAAAERDTGVDLAVADCLFVSGYARIVVVEAVETLDFGTLTGETGADPNGFLATAAFDTAGIITATAGDLYGTVSDGVAQSLSYTATAGTTLPTGYLGLRYERLFG